MEKSKAKKIKTLIKKQKGLIGSKLSLMNIDEPFVILLRRNQEAEFFESATKGEFIFTHSDGNTRTIYLTPYKKWRFPYGERDFRGYICHEDFPLPLPENPLVTAEEINIIINKSMNDLRNMMTKELQAWKGIIWAVLGGLALIALVYFLFKQPEQAVPIAKAGYEGVKQVAQNITITNI